MPKRDVVMRSRSRRSFEFFLFTTIGVVATVLIAILGIFPALSIFDMLKILALIAGVGYGLTAIALGIEKLEGWWNEKF